MYSLGPLTEGELQGPFACLVPGMRGAPPDQHARFLACGVRPLTDMTNTPTHTPGPSSALGPDQRQRLPVGAAGGDEERSELHEPHTHTPDTPEGVVEERPTHTHTHTDDSVKRSDPYSNTHHAGPNGNTITTGGGGHGPPNPTENGAAPSHGAAPKIRTSSGMGKTRSQRLPRRGPGPTNLKF